MGRGPGAWGAAAALALLLAGPAQAGSREETIGILEGLPDGWDAARLTARVDDGNGGAYRVGDPISFQIGAAQDAHALLFYLDSYGVATLFLVQGDGAEGRISGGTVASVPSRGDGFSLQVVPPVGRETLFFVATRTPIAGEDLGLAPDSRVSDPIDAERAPAAARKLVEATRALGEDAVAVVRIDQRIVGGSDEVEYTTREIVQHFQATRSLQRPRLPMHLQFEYDSAELTGNARENLDEMGRALQHPSLKGRKIAIGGHTDDQGDETYNEELSRKRAESVAKYLAEQHGLGRDQVEVRAYGEAQPLEPGTSEQARATNRRVDFELGH